MKIKIKDIRPGGISVNGAIEIADIGQSDQDYIQFIDPIKAEGSVERIDNMVLANVKTTSQIKSYCSRCLDPIKKAWDKSFRLDFEIDPTAEDIDLGEEVRQEVILNLPMSLQCQADCQSIASNK